MQIPCSEQNCIYQDYGECMLTRTTAGGKEKHSCSYFRSKTKHHL